jgi:hypothetical protein
MDSLHLRTTSSSTFRNRSIVGPADGFRKSRYRRRVRGSVLAVLVLALAACGGASRTTVADCLNDAGFLVSGSGTEVRGTSPAGVGFTLRMYAEPAAAKRAAARLEPATTAVAARGVVDWRGNPSPAARLTRAELRTIGRCVSRSNS